MRGDWIWVFCCVWLFLVQGTTAQEITFRTPELHHSIHVQAEQIQSWQKGETKMFHLRGPVSVVQERYSATADEGLLMVQRLDEQPGEVYRVITYLEGKVVINLAREEVAASDSVSVSDRIVDDVWLGRLFTNSAIETDSPVHPLSAEEPAIVARAQRQHSKGLTTSIQPAQFQERTPLMISPQTGAITAAPPSDMSAPTESTLADQIQQSLTTDSVFSNASVQSQTRQPTFGDPAATQDSAPVGSSGMVSGADSQVILSGRDSTVDLNLNRIPDPAMPSTMIWYATGGVRVTINSPRLDNSQAFRGDESKQLFILADNVVAWESSLPDGRKKWEIYLEGNVIFAKDRRVIYAEKMFYDASTQSGTILRADVLTPVQQYKGLVRLKADVIQQVDANNLSAYGAALTSSRIGVPRYWLQADNIDITQQTVLQTDARGQTIFNSQTGQPEFEDQYLPRVVPIASTRQAFLFWRGLDSARI